MTQKTGYTGRFLAFMLSLCLLCTSCQSHTELDGSDSPSSGTGSPSSQTSVASSQESKPVVVAFQRKIAHIMCDDGWCFQFVEEKNKPGLMEDHRACVFLGFNLRYRYDEDYAITEELMDGNKLIAIETYLPSGMIWQEGPESHKRDSAIIHDFFELSEEEMLQADPKDYSFEALDKDMFFELVHTALEGDPEEVGSFEYLTTLPSFAMTAEPEYLDGYKIQIGYIEPMGNIDELFIDICYQTGDAYHDYVQLSDMVEDGSASPEQAEAYRKLKEIERAIVEHNQLNYGAESYRTLELGGIQFERLATYLENLHQGKYEGYLGEMIELSLEWMIPR